jgi:hypothetical protein
VVQSTKPLNLSSTSAERPAGEIAARKNLIESRQFLSTAHASDPEPYPSNIVPPRRRRRARAARAGSEEHYEQRSSRRRRPSSARAGEDGGGRSARPSAYGEARDAVRDLRHGGEHLVEEGRARFRDISDRGHALADEALERGQHYRDRAVRHGRTLAARADENRTTTLALVAAVAFGLGWLARPTR